MHRIVTSTKRIDTIRFKVFTLASLPYVRHFSENEIMCYFIVLKLNGTKL
jgi:hypothetical protein